MCAAVINVCLNFGGRKKREKQSTLACILCSYYSTYKFVVNDFVYLMSRTMDT